MYCIYGPSFIKCIVFTICSFDSPLDFPCQLRDGLFLVLHYLVIAYILRNSSIYRVGGNPLVEYGSFTYPHISEMKSPDPSRIPWQSPSL